MKKNKKTSRSIMGSLLISSVSANSDILTTNSATLVNVGSFYTWSDYAYTGDYYNKDRHWGKNCYEDAWATHYNAHPWGCMSPANG